MRARTRVAAVWILVLALAGLAAVGSAWAQRPGAPTEPGWGASDRDRSDAAYGPGGAGMRERGMQMRHRREGLMRELDLTSEQRQKIVDLREKQERTAIRMRADIQTARLDLRRLMRAEKPDRSAINRQIDRIAQLEAEGRKARVGMMLDVRGVLTPEQQQKARERFGAGG